MSEQKQIKMVGSDLEAARAFVETLERNRKEMQELYDEFYQRRTFLAEAHAALAREKWNTVVEPHGIDPQETWTRGTWRLDTTFLELYALAFLCEHDPLPEPMQNITFDAPTPKMVH